MLIQPILLKQGWFDIARSRDYAQALAAPTLALEGLRHRPLADGVEPSEFVADGKRPVINHANLEASHVEDQGGLARVVAVDQVGVEFNAGVGTIGHGGIGGLGGGRGGGDFGEQRSCRESNEGASRRLEGLVTFEDLQAIRVARLLPGRVEFGHCACGLGFCLGGRWKSTTGWRGGVEAYITISLVQGSQRRRNPTGLQRHGIEHTHTYYTWNMHVEHAF